MELLQLKYFMKVAKVQHMTKAANELYISQSSLSRTINRLEEDLGVELFKRDGRQIKLNEYGNIFLKRVEKAFYELEEGKIEIKELLGMKSRTITVGATITMLLPDVFKEFLRINPNIKFQLFQLSTKEIEKRLEEGTIDFAISTPPIKKKGVISIPLKKDKFFLAVDKDHPFSKKKSVKIKEIKNEPIIALTTDYIFQENIKNLCIENGFEPNIMFESNDIEVMFKLVLDNFGVAFMPEYWWDTDRTNFPVKIELSDVSTERTISLSWNEKNTLTKDLEEFKTFLIHFFK